MFSFPSQPPSFLAPLPPLIVSIWALSHSKVASNVQTSPDGKFWASLLFQVMAFRWRNQGPNKQPSGQNSALAEHTWQICGSHERRYLIDIKSILGSVSQSINQPTKQAMRQWGKQATKQAIRQTIKHICLSRKKKMITKKSSQFLKLPVICRFGIHIEFQASEIPITKLSENLRFSQQAVSVRPVVLDHGTDGVRGLGPRNAASHAWRQCFWCTKSRSWAVECCTCWCLFLKTQDIQDDLWKSEKKSLRIWFLL